MNKKNIHKYLSTYAEKAAIDFFHQWTPSKTDGQTWRYTDVVVIPVYDEPINQLAQLIDSHYSESTPLFIFVCNAPDNANKDSLRNTRAGLKWLKSRECQSSVVTIDACSEGKQLPADKAVGLARKLGCDFALMLISQGVVNTQWIHTTDADVSLPTDYFLQTKRLATLPSACVYAFQHQKSQGYETEAALYDFKLRYYVEGLKWAGSAYAFHTIGSLIAIKASSYAEVRGFPKRNAGEDFYLLNKLSKLNGVKSLSGTPILVSSRPSQRVPFGTGQAILKIKEQGQYFHAPIFYAPVVFAHLKRLLTFINNINEQKLHKLKKMDLSTLASEIGAFDHRVIKEFDVVLHQIHFNKVWQHAVKQGKSPAQFIRHFHQGFDAFKTLRFIHEMRDHFYPNVSYVQLQQSCTWLKDRLPERDPLFDRFNTYGQIPDDPVSS